MFLEDIHRVRPKCFEAARTEIGECYLSVPSSRDQSMNCFCEHRTDSKETVRSGKAHNGENFPPKKVAKE